MTAIAYVRQSRRADQDVATSRPAQLEAIRRLAERDGLGPDDVTIYEDLGRSGGAGKERLRPGYQEFMRALEAGPTTVYALALSRLGRSVPELYRVLRLAQEHGTRIVLAKEGTMDPTTAVGAAQFGLMAVISEFVRTMAVEAAAESIAVKRSNGVVMGRRPYGDGPGEDVATVVAAFRRAGSANGAAVILNAANVPSALGRRWTANSVANVVRRASPGLLGRHPARGAKPSSGFRLYRLLCCPHDGRLLTASRDGRGDRDTVYRCHSAEADGQHPRPYRIQEAAVLPWIMAEAARWRIPADAKDDAATAAAKRSELEGKRARWLEMYAEGLLDKAERDRRLAAIVDALEVLGVGEVVKTLPRAIDWARTPAQEVNAVLRALWDYIELGPDFRPVRAEWRLPAEWIA